MKQSLLHFMLEHDKNRIYKIGAKDGSGFFFIGTGQEFLDKVDNLDLDLRKSAEQIAASGRKICRKYCVEAPSISQYLTEAMTAADANDGKGFKVSFDGYLAMCKKYVDQSNARYKGMVKKEKYAKDWQMLHKREVVESYRSEDEPGGLIVIVTGNEAGRYWSLSEVQNGRMYV